MFLKLPFFLYKISECNKISKYTKRKQLTINHELLIKKRPPNPKLSLQHIQSNYIKVN